MNNINLFFIILFLNINLLNSNSLLDSVLSDYGGSTSLSSSGLSFDITDTQNYNISKDMNKFIDYTNLEDKFSQKIKIYNALDEETTKILNIEYDKNNLENFVNLFWNKNSDLTSNSLETWNYENFLKRQNFDDNFYGNNVFNGKQDRIETVSTQYAFNLFCGTSKEIFNIPTEFKCNIYKNSNIIEKVISDKNGLRVGLYVSDNLLYNVSNSFSINKIKDIKKTFLPLEDDNRLYQDINIKQEILDNYNIGNFIVPNDFDTLKIQIPYKQFHLVHFGKNNKLETHFNPFTNTLVKEDGSDDFIISTSTIFSTLKELDKITNDLDNLSDFYSKLAFKVFENNTIRSNCFSFNNRLNIPSVGKSIQSINTKDNIVDKKEFYFKNVNNSNNLFNFQQFPIDIELEPTYNTVESFIKEIENYYFNKGIVYKDNNNQKQSIFKPYSHFLKPKMDSYFNFKDIDNTESLNNYILKFIKNIEDFDITKNGILKKCTDTSTLEGIKECQNYQPINWETVKNGILSVENNKKFNGNSKDGYTLHSTTKDFDFVTAIGIGITNNDKIVYSPYIQPSVVNCDLKNPCNIKNVFFDTSLNSSFKSFDPTIHPDFDVSMFNTIKCESKTRELCSIPVKSNNEYRYKDGKFLEMDKFNPPIEEHNPGNVYIISLPWGQNIAYVKPIIPNNSLYQNEIRKYGFPFYDRILGDNFEADVSVLPSKKGFYKLKANVRKIKNDNQNISYALFVYNGNEINYWTSKKNGTETFYGNTATIETDDINWTSSNIPIEDNLNCKDENGTLGKGKSRKIYFDLMAYDNELSKFSLYSHTFIFSEKKYDTNLYEIEKKKNPLLTKDLFRIPTKDDFTNVETCLETGESHTWWGYTSRLEGNLDVCEPLFDNEIDLIEENNLTKKFYQCYVENMGTDSCEVKFNEKVFSMENITELQKDWFMTKDKAGEFCTCIAPDPEEIENPNLDVDNILDILDEIEQEKNKNSEETIDNNNLNDDILGINDKIDNYIPSDIEEIIEDLINDDDKIDDKDTEDNDSDKKTDDEFIPPWILDDDDIKDNNKTEDFNNTKETNSTEDFEEFNLSDENITDNTVEDNIGILSNLVNMGSGNSISSIGGSSSSSSSGSSGSSGNNNSVSNSELNDEKENTENRSSEEEEGIETEYFSMSILRNIFSEHAKEKTDEDKTGKLEKTDEDKTGKLEKINNPKYFDVNLSTSLYFHLYNNEYNPEMEDNKDNRKFYDIKEDEDFKCYGYKFILNEVKSIPNEYSLEEKEKEEYAGYNMPFENFPLEIKGFLLTSPTNVISELVNFNNDKYQSFLKSLEKNKENIDLNNESIYLNKNSREDYLKIYKQNISVPFIKNVFVPNNIFIKYDFNYINDFLTLNYLFFDFYSLDLETLNDSIYDNNFKIGFFTKLIDPYNYQKLLNSSYFLYSDLLKNEKNKIKTKSHKLDLINHKKRFFEEKNYDFYKKVNSTPYFKYINIDFNKIPSLKENKKNKKIVLRSNGTDKFFRNTNINNVEFLFSEKDIEIENYNFKKYEINNIRYKNQHCYRHSMEMYDQYKEVRKDNIQTQYEDISIYDPDTSNFYSLKENEINVIELNSFENELQIVSPYCNQTFKEKYINKDLKKNICLFNIAKSNNKKIDFYLDRHIQNKMRFEVGLEKHFIIIKDIVGNLNKKEILTPFVSNIVDEFGFSNSKLYWIKFKFNY